MGGKSKLWPLSAALLAVGGVIEAAAVALFWRPCSGSMLNGSVFAGYRFDTEFSDACLRAMDAGVIVVLPSPEAGGWTLSAGLGAVAALLLATAWLLVLPALPVPRPAKWIATAPAFAVAVLVAVSGTVTLNPVGGDALMTLLALLVDVAALLALAALAAAKLGGQLLLRAAVVLLAVTAPGAFHQIVSYLAMMALSEASWDIPPGTGYVSVVLILISAGLTAFFWWSDGRRQAVPRATPVRAPGEPAF